MKNQLGFIQIPFLIIFLVTLVAGTSAYVVKEIIEIEPGIIQATESAIEQATSTEPIGTPITQTQQEEIIQAIPEILQQIAPLIAEQEQILVVPVVIQEPEPVVSEPVTQEPIPEPVTQEPVVIAQVVEEIVIPLEITSTNITPELNSVKIEWETNSITESKIFLLKGNDIIKVAMSETNPSTRHFVNLTGLSSQTTYSYELESIENGNFVIKKSGSFTTLAPPPPPIPSPKLQLSSDTILKLPDGYILHTKPGVPINLHWTTENVATCAASDAWSGNKSTSDTEIIIKDTTGLYKYYLSCDNGEGKTISRYVKIRVHPAITLVPDNVRKYYENIQERTEGEYIYSDAGQFTIAGHISLFDTAILKKLSVEFSGQVLQDVSNFHIRMQDLNGIYASQETCSVSDNTCIINFNIEPDVEIRTGGGVRFKIQVNSQEFYNSPDIEELTIKILGLQYITKKDTNTIHNIHSSQVPFIASTARYE